MPHFTVTKVEDSEEEAAASVPPEGESSLAEAKARIQHSDETGKCSTWELWELTGFFCERNGNKYSKHLLQMEKKYCG